MSPSSGPGGVADAEHQAGEPVGLDLTACDREPIHVPGAIQPHGLLLVADADGGVVVGGAGALEERLTPDWHGRALTELLAQDLAPALAATRASGAPVPLTMVPGRREAFDATLHRAGGVVIVELEPVDKAPRSAAAMLAELDAAGTSFERASDLQSLCDRAALLFRAITGFDRVMIYRFLDDGAGVVLAEDRDASLGTFLHHHFPASDIPRQARALYVSNRIRVIPNVDYHPAPLRPQGAMLAGLDLGDATLRSVSPIHVQYLRNMGIAASASVSIVKDGLLWGLIACHHRTPRTLPYVLRQACATLAGGLARQIRAKEQAEIYRERIRLRAAEDDLLARLNPEVPLVAALVERAADFQRLIDADGFALVRGDQVRTAGMCPSNGDILQLARWVGARPPGEPVASHTLARIYPAAANYAESASGLVAVALGAELPATLLWFRAEEPQLVEWAGNPHKAVAVRPGEQLTPRASFEGWREEVRGIARRWTLTEVETVQRLRRALLEMNRGQRLRELNRELGVILADKEALLAQKDHLLREVNHRVQNSLQLVQSFLGLQARQSADALGPLEEAQRRVAAVALVHRRLYQADQVETVDLGRYLDELIGDMRGTMDAAWSDALTTDLAPMLISADRAVNVGLVLTELVINAEKYAYGGAPGPIAIELEQYRNQFRMIVADHGSGKTRTREGFGTRMMTAMVQRLDGTIEQRDNAPGLRVIVTAPLS